MSVPSTLTLSTAHPDEAHQFLARMYASHEVRLKGRVERFLFRFRDADLGNQGWSVMEHSHASLLTDIAPFGQVVVGRILNGAYSCRMGPDEVTGRRGGWILIDPDLPSDMAWSPDVRIAIVRFDRATLDRLTAGLSGRDTGQPMRYPLSLARSPQHARALDQLDVYVKSLLTNEITRDSTLIRAQISRLVATHLLESFPIVPGGSSSEPRAHVGPASLRRALAFIDDHHDADIGLPEIANAARVSQRALQQTFHEHENTTPIAYLRRARLASAHRDLQEADPGTGVTVSDIASRWGFTNPGRFAAAYREVYGRQPSQTLRSLKELPPATGQSAAAGFSWHVSAGRIAAMTFGDHDGLQRPSRADRAGDHPDVHQARPGAPCTRDPAASGQRADRPVAAHRTRGRAVRSGSAILGVRLARRPGAGPLSA